TGNRGPDRGTQKSTRRAGVECAAIIPTILAIHRHRQSRNAKHVLKTTFRRNKKAEQGGS
ncbi:MAG TPA: hypothetical protein PLZ43_12475, partial [bacterium]|nr:hypothetical protein [bacterium]